ncbi:hypothetical protein O181_031776 [Austropuccinia psidii MF-1]|uniref:serine C-palmitoyltransferase n=1 Tax=Austropuccinia psidii MF-1 TaxID=1389203 RepID=A0A9Q3CVI8_9BASI|nr:hypothetical protein [Austropuccinia psidii MF-1]
MKPSMAATLHEAQRHDGLRLGWNDPSPNEINRRRTVLRDSRSGDDHGDNDHDDDIGLGNRGPIIRQNCRTLWKRDIKRRRPQSEHPIPSNKSQTSELSHYLDYLFKTSTFLIRLLKSVPGSDILIRYIKSSHQNDPFRTLLEILLVFFIIRTWRQSKTRGDSGSGKNFVKLTEKEIDELVAEWIPEPLVDPPLPITHALSRPPIIVGSPVAHPKILYGPAAQKFIESARHDDEIDEKDLKTVTNLASANFAGLIGNEQVKLRAIQQLRRSGVGSCGPPGFYGTFDVHMELEQDIANFLGLQSSIIYAQAFTAVSSVIPSFSKRGDIIVVDRGVNFAIQKGIQISRSTIRWYDHNDMSSLEKVLEQLKLEEVKFRRKLTRKFIITEGLFESDGQLCDLPTIVKLKEKYKFRLILDETWSIGTLGKTGRGVTEYFGVPPKSVDLLVGSLATSFNSGGGFCAGSTEVVSHQRINSAALVFSAALPPLLATAASETIKILSEGDGLERFIRLRQNTRLFRETIQPIAGEGGLINIPSHEESPLIHITLRQPNESAAELENPMISFEDQEHLLQQVVDRCILDHDLLITRTKKLWEQEIEPMAPSLRICVTGALEPADIVQAGMILMEVFKSVLHSK